jgi:SAM-dependent methyltransferase
MSVAIEPRVLRVVSAIERLRIWLLKQKWFSSYFLPALPRWVRWGLRTVYLAPVDMVDRLRGDRTGLMPPRAYNCSGAVIDYKDSGEALVKALEEVAGLTPSSRVLDIGCGYGRLAAAMPSYLDANGSYDGLDIVPDAIRWCRANIFSPHCNIRFKMANVFNREYNPHGTENAAEYRLPFEDQSFDLVVLVSVFTHMLPAEVDHYLGEIARVMEPRGWCFASYLLLTEQSKHLMSRKGSSQKFIYNMGSHWLVSRKVPELAVGYDENFLRDLYAKHALSWVLYPGYWCGQTSHWSRDSRTGEQDVLVARKT